MHTPTLPRDRKKTGGPKAAGLTPDQIADRLHNTVCQSITGARFLLSAVGNQAPQDVAELRKQLKRVDAALEKSCTEIRALAKELRTAAENDAAR